MLDLKTDTEDIDDREDIDCGVNEDKEQITFLPKTAEQIKALDQFESLSELFGKIKLESLEPKWVFSKVLSSLAALSVLSSSFGSGVEMPKPLKMGLLAGAATLGLGASYKSRNLERDLKLREIRMLEGLEGHNRAVEVFYQSMLSPTIVRDALKVKQEEDELKELIETFEGFDWLDWLAGSTSVMLLGNAGSAKTTLARWLLGIFPEPYQLVILDIHNKESDYPESVRKYIISDLDKIIAYMQWFIQVETPRRLKRFKDGQQNTMLINYLEEVGNLVLMLDDEDQKNIVKKFITSVISTRKLNCFNLGVNQVGNVKGNGLAGLGDVLQSYSQVVLGKNAIKWARTYGVSKLARQLLTPKKYNCLVDNEYVVKHPTHGDYEKVKRGQPPKNLKDFTCLDFPEFDEFLAYYECEELDSSVTNSNDDPVNPITVSNEYDDYLALRDGRINKQSWEVLLQSIWGKNGSWGDLKKPNSHKNKAIRIADKYLEDWVKYLVQENGITSLDRICSQIYGNPDKVSESRKNKISRAIERSNR